MDAERAKLMGLVVMGFLGIVGAVVVGNSISRRTSVKYYSKYLQSDEGKKAQEEAIKLLMANFNVMKQ